MCITNGCFSFFEKKIKNWMAYGLRSWNNCEFAVCVNAVVGNQLEIYWFHQQ